MILRNHGAQVSAAACLGVIVGVPVMWSAAVARAAGCAPPPFNLACLAAIGIRIAIEVPSYISFLVRSIGTALSTILSNTLPNRIREIHRFQEAVVRATPNAIAAQERNLENFYGVDIRLTVPGRSDGFVTPPLKKGNFLSTALVVAGRFFTRDSNWPSEGNFGSFNSVGKAKTLWNGTAGITIALMAAVHGSRNYVLTSQSGPLEYGPSNLTRRREFSVVATAVERNASAGKLVMPAIFSSPISPQDQIIAYAQAETYNGIDGRLSQLGVPIPYPFRVWTTWGWQWQPRLTRGDQFRSAFLGDSSMRSIYGRLRIQRSDESGFHRVTLH